MTWAMRGIGRRAIGNFRKSRPYKVEGLVLRRSWDMPIFSNRQVKTVGGLRRAISRSAQVMGLYRGPSFLMQNRWGGSLNHPIPLASHYIGSRGENRWLENVTRPRWGKATFFKSIAQKAMRRGGVSGAYAPGHRFFGNQYVKVAGQIKRSLTLGRSARFLAKARVLTFKPRG